MDVDAVYVALEPLETKGMVDAIRTLQLGGGTITRPFKQEVMQFLDEIDEDAQRIGAVNVVVNQSGFLIGHNSDWHGALNALRSIVDPNGKRVALLGSGGAARAVAFGLATTSAETTVFNRTEDKAREICSAFSHTYGGTLNDVTPEFDIIMNATSMGFGEDTDSSPIPAEVIREGSVAFDVIARPRSTKFLKLASGKGCTIIPGVLMGAHQAVPALEWLTGVRPPIDVLLKHFGA